MWELIWYQNLWTGHHKWGEMTPLFTKTNITNKYKQAWKCLPLVKKSQEMECCNTRIIYVQMYTLYMCCPQRKLLAWPVKMCASDHVTPLLGNPPKLHMTFGVRAKSPQRSSLLGPLLLQIASISLCSSHTCLPSSYFKPFLLAVTVGTTAPWPSPPPAKLAHPLICFRSLLQCHLLNRAFSCHPV